MSQAGRFGTSGGGGGGANTFNGNVGTAVPAGGVINIIGAGVISTVGAGDTITISDAGGGGFMWNEVLIPAQNMASNNGYVANNAVLVTLTLPPVSVLGDVIEVTGKGAGGWSIAQGAGQQINFGAASTTVGAGGSLSSTLQFDSVRLVCITANLEWNVLSAVGNLAVV